jgi:hypothetical protein
MEWVEPFYLEILHGNFTGLQGIKRKRFIYRVNEACSRIDDSVIEKLLLSEDWRERIMGGWFAGLMECDKFEHQIGELLLESNRTYAGQGYCFALGRFADAASVDYLVRYLDKYLVQLDCFYDQDWAIAALMWVDGLRGTKHSAKYLAPNGLWERFVKNKPQWSLDYSRSQYASIMGFCAENFDAI